MPRDAPNVEAIRLQSPNPNDSVHTPLVTMFGDPVSLVVSDMHNGGIPNSSSQMLDPNQLTKSSQSLSLLSQKHRCCMLSYTFSFQPSLI